MLIDTAADFDVTDYLRKEMMPHFLCPGCGHGIALRALLWAIHDLGLDKDKLAVVSGIGCAGRLSAYIDANTFHVTHGRPLAYATGLALARPDLHVVVITGDGDCLAIGGNHLIHACRRNLKLTCLMLNNEVYGMTGGQVSPTTSETTADHDHAARQPGAAFRRLRAGHRGRRRFRRPRSDAPRAQAQGTDQGRARASGLRLRRSAVRLHGDLRPQERSGLLAGNDDAAERATSGRAPIATRSTRRSVRTTLPTGILTQNDRPEYGAAYRRAAAARAGASS